MSNTSLNSEFSNICKQMIETHIAKNHDYGNSFHDLYEELGMVYAYGHLKEKLNRIKSLMKSDNMVKTESLEDSLLDLANYAIMTLVELHNT